MTAQAPYESLTTVDEVTDAHDNGRVVECLPPGRADWLRTFAHGATVAADLAAGWQYRAAFPERAPVSAAHAWRRRWKGSPPEKGFSIVAEDHLTHPTEIAFLGEVDGDAVDAIINAHNASLATPAPPVGADWRIDDLETSLSVMIEWFDTVAEVAKWTRDNANAAFMARDACEETLNAAGPYAAAPTPAEARGVGDGVRALVAKWREENRASRCRPDRDAYDVRTDKMREQCASQLEAALTANKPAGEDRPASMYGLVNTRQAQAQGSEGVDRESLVREVIDLARKLEPWDGKTFNEELHAKLRKLAATHAQAGEGSNG